MNERAHTALVTGGGTGIGAAICRRLGRAGALVLVAGRNQSNCSAVAEEVRAEGGRAQALELDVTIESSVKHMAQEVERLHGPVDWIVNNAGIAISAPLLGEGSSELHQRHMDVNYHGAVRVFEALLPSMLERGYGRVVQIASSASLYGYAYVSAYTASKHALLGYTRAAALELRRTGVALCAVCPHYVDTQILDRAKATISRSTGKTEEEVRAYFESENPGGVIITPLEVADATFDLLAGDATGRVVELIGGGSREVEPGTPLST